MTNEEWVKEIAAEHAAFIEAETARIMQQVDEAMREALAVAQSDDDDDEPSRPIVTRADYAPKDQESRYLVRDEGGVPLLKLVDAGDRLAIWSPIDGGALINPKGPGLRSFGLVATYARGSEFHASAFRAADLRKGQPVELRREPDNAHDRNAIALHAPRARNPFGYVQRGRAAALARRIDAGEQLTAVSMRGPGRGRDDDSAFLLIGSADDLSQMLR